MIDFIKFKHHKGNVKESIFIGRFQPLHKGHMSAIKHILSKDGQVTILIGSSDQGGTKDNPFSLNERRDMLEKSLENEGISGRCSIKYVPDVGDDREWLSLVFEKCPEIKKIYSNNRWVKNIFTENNLEVEEIPFFRRELFEGTAIRKLIDEKKDWGNRVPEEIREIIKKRFG